MSKRILVTGAAGFIGSNLTDAILRTGCQIMGIDNFDPYYNRLIKENNIKEALKNPNFHFKEGDIRDITFTDTCLSEFKPDIIVHLAAKAGVRPSLANPMEYYDVNILGTLNLLEMMRKNKIKKMIFASSSSVYGNNSKVPFSETDNVDFPISPYAATKKSGELLCHTYHHLYDFDIFCLRFFTVYGPRQRPDLAIHKFTDCILKMSPIELYGDGNSARDYTYIDDIINGILKSIERLKGFEIINLGESRTISLAELVKSLEKNLNRKAILRQLPVQSGDVQITYANIEKAKAILGYKPVWEFERGLIEFLNWKSL